MIVEMSPRQWTRAALPPHSAVRLCLTEGYSLIGQRLRLDFGSEAQPPRILMSCEPVRHSLTALLLRQSRNNLKGGRSSFAE
jgi:hypothetical protein